MSGVLRPIVSIWIWSTFPEVSKPPVAPSQSQVLVPFVDQKMAKKIASYYYVSHPNYIYRDSSHRSARFNPHTVSIFHRIILLRDSPTTAIYSNSAEPANQLCSYSPAVLGKRNMLLGCCIQEIVKWQTGLVFQLYIYTWTSIFSSKFPATSLFLPIFYPPWSRRLGAKGKNYSWSVVVRIYLVLI